MDLKKYEKLNHVNTLREYSNEISSIDFVVSEISEHYKLKDGQVCYIFGKGGHPKSTYQLLKNQYDKEIFVAYLHHHIPKYLSPLKYIIASYYGIIQIRDLKILNVVFSKLAYMSMVGAYIFDVKFEAEFVQHIKQRPVNFSEVNYFVKNDPGYFIYQVDADNSESLTGAYEIISYGKDCPEELVQIVNRYS